MKLYIGTVDSYDWSRHLHHEETAKMLNNKEILTLQVYDDIPAQQQVLELTIEELKMISDNLLYGYGENNSEYPCLELDLIGNGWILFNLHMESIY